MMMSTVEQRSWGTKMAEKLEWNVASKRWIGAETGRPTVHLQGIGEVFAKPAMDFMPGEFMGWNYGGATKITRIDLVGGSMLDVWSLGHAKPRRLKRSRLVAIASEKWRVCDDHGRPICP